MKEKGKVTKRNREGGGEDIVTSQEVAIGVHIKQRTINKATQLMSSYNHTHTPMNSMCLYMRHGKVSQHEKL